MVGMVRLPEMKQQDRRQRSDATDDGDDEKQRKNDDLPDYSPFRGVEEDDEEHHDRASADDHGEGLQSLCTHRPGVLELRPLHCRFHCRDEFGHGHPPI